MPYLASSTTQLFILILWVTDMCFFPYFAYNLCLRSEFSDYQSLQNTVSGEAFPKAFHCVPLNFTTWTQRLSYFERPKPVILWIFSCIIPFLGMVEEINSGSEFLMFT